MTDMAALFPDRYEASRARFRQSLGRVQRQWPMARLVEQRLSAEQDLTIDWIEAEPLVRKDKLLLLTTGEHGIEAYVGVAMLQLFLAEYLARLNPQDTGLCLVHAINPWGMKHRRRTNAANVDVNRNFLAAPIDAAFNPGYTRLYAWLNPLGPVRSWYLSNLSYMLGLLWSLVWVGAEKIRQAALLGQYRFPKGIYYGGDSAQEETRTLVELYRNHLQMYEQIVHLDMHTGYGPRYQMSIVNSALESRDSKDLAQRFSYPLVVKSDPNEFYSIQGDMIDYVCTLARNEFPGKRLYSTAFEFGTLGDSFPAVLRSLRAMILENQAYWFDAGDSPLRERIGRDFQEMFFPQEAEWRTKAVADARQAFQGILAAEGFIGREIPSTHDSL
jgi:predicted deacylase